MKKLKSVGQFLAALSLAVVLSSGAVVPAHATGFGGGERVGEFGSGGFGGTTVNTAISYNALSELCVIVNDQITQGLFEDVSPFCDTSAPLAATVRYDLDNGFYVISVKVGTTYYDLRNNSGGLYVAYEDSDSSLAGIWGFLSRIDLALTSENGLFALWMSLLDTDLDIVNINLEQISLKVQSVVDYTNVIANGTVTLVEKMDDLIEAVNGISISADGATINFDTLPITNKLDEVIDAIEGISINVEGGTVNFDTNPITDKLDEVITAINSISVTGGGSCVHEYETVPLIDSTCTAYGLSLFKCRICNYIGTMIVPPVAHTWEFSDQTTYRTVLPLRSYDYTPRSDTRSEWALIDSFWPDVDEWYQVIYNGVEYYVMAWDYGGREFGNVALGNRNYVHDDTTVTETTYPFTIVWSGLEEVGAGWVELRSFTQEPFTLSIAKLDTIPTCSVCGENEDTVSLVGAIEHATAVLQAAILSANGDPAVSGDYSDLISSLESISAKLEQNHADVMEGLVVIYEWLSTKSLIAPCEHSYMPVVMVEPSCDFPGVTKFICDYCDTFRMELSAPLGHEWMDFSPPEPVALLEDAPFGLIDGSSPPMLGNYQLITLVPGEMYTVVYNGTEYVTECVSVEYSGLTVPAIGNVEAYYGTGSNGLPFVITSAEVLGGSGCIDLFGATFARISIYTVPADVEDVPSYMQSLHICSRCDSGCNLAALMEFLDTRLVPGSGGGGSIDVSSVVDKLTSIENALSNLGGDVNIENNTNIEVSEDNDSYNIFYVEDPDGGDDQSIVDLSGDALKVFGKLLNFLYQVGFKDALDGAGPGIGDLSDFYLDNAEGSADLWAS